MTDREYVLVSFGDTEIRQVMTDDVRLAFWQNADGRIFVDHVMDVMCPSPEYTRMWSLDGGCFDIRGSATSPEEFWLKARASGFVFGGERGA